MNDGAQTFAQYTQQQACSDLILAFQENHKVAAKNLLDMHMNEELKANRKQLIMNSVFSFVISNTQYQDQNSIKPVIYFSQVANIVTQELLEEGDQFRKDINSKIVEFCSKLSMKYIPNLIKF